MTCVRPTNSTASFALYDFTNATEVLDASNFSVGGVVCAAEAFVSGGNGVTASACFTEGGEYSVTGCTGAKKEN